MILTRHYTGSLPRLISVCTGVNNKVDAELRINFDLV